MWPYFDEGADTLRIQRSQRRFKLDGLAHMTAPANRVRRLGWRHWFTSHVGNEQDSWSIQADLPHCLLEPIQHWLHQCGVKGMRYVQVSGLNSLLTQAKQDGRHRRGGP